MLKDTAKRVHQREPKAARKREVLREVYGMRLAQCAYFLFAFAFVQRVLLRVRPSWRNQSMFRRDPNSPTLSQLLRQWFKDRGVLRDGPDDDLPTPSMVQHPETVLRIGPIILPNEQLEHERYSEHKQRATKYNRGRKRNRGEVVES